jgi:hypothetical protein
MILTLNLIPRSPSTLLLDESPIVFGHQLHNGLFNGELKANLASSGIILRKAAMPSQIY